MEITDYVRPGLANLSHGTSQSRARGRRRAALAVPAMMSLSLIQCRPALDPPVVRLTDHVQSVADAGLTREGMRSLLIDRRLLTFAVCVVLFLAVSAAIGPSLAAQVTRRRPDLATLVIAAMILLPQGIVAGISSWVGRQAKAIGRRPLLMVGRVCSRFTPRSPRFSLASTRWLVTCYLLNAVSGAIFGVMMPVIAADLTRRSGGFNLFHDALGVAISAAAFGANTAALGLALVRLCGVLVAWGYMPETRATASLSELEWVPGSPEKPQH